MFLPDQASSLNQCWASGNTSSSQVNLLLDSMETPAACQHLLILGQWFSHYGLLEMWYSTHRREDSSQIRENKLADGSVLHVCFPLIHVR